MECIIFALFNDNISPVSVTEYQAITLLRRVNWVGWEKVVAAEFKTTSEYLMQGQEKMTKASVRIVGLQDETLTQDVSYKNEC